MNSRDHLEEMISRPKSHPLKIRLRYQTGSSDADNSDNLVQRELQNPSIHALLSHIAIILDPTRLQEFHLQIQGTTMSARKLANLCFRHLASQETPILRSLKISLRVLRPVTLPPEVLVAAKPNLQHLLLRNVAADWTVIKPIDLQFPNLLSLEVGPTLGPRPPWETTRSLIFSSLNLEVLHLHNLLSNDFPPPNDHQLQSIALPALRNSSSATTGFFPSFTMVKTSLGS